MPPLDRRHRRQSPRQLVARDGFRAAAGKLFYKSCLGELARFYPSTDAAEAARSATLLIGDLVISEQTLAMLSLQRKAGARVYGYEFAFASPYLPRALHGSDPGYVFGTLGPRRGPALAEPGAADRAMSQLLTAYWTTSRGPAIRMAPACRPGRRSCPQVVLSLILMGQAACRRHRFPRGCVS